MASLLILSKPEIRLLGKHRPRTGYKVMLRGQEVLVCVKTKN